MNIPLNLNKQKKQVLLLYTTSAIGVVVGLLSSIVNTRFLEPADYGDVRYVQNIINFIASLLLFGYFLSGCRLLAISKDEERSRKIRGALIVVLGIASAVLVTAVALCVLFHGKNPTVSHLFLVALPVCLSPLLLNYINNVAQGDNHIGRLSIARLAPSLLYVILAYLIYSRFGATPTRMILLQMGLSTVIISLIILSVHPSFSGLKPIFKELNEENKRYGFQLYLGSLFMVTTGYIAGMTLSFFNTDNVQVGFYTLSTTVTAPLALLPSIIGTTYFKQFASQDRIPSRLMKVSILITFLTCLVFVIIIRGLIVFFYTERYAPVGVYASVLAMGTSIHGFGDMINRYLGSHGQGKQIRNASIANGIFMVFGNCVLVYFFKIWGAIATTITCDLIYASLIIYYYRRFVKKSEDAEV